MCNYEKEPTDVRKFKYYLSVRWLCTGLLVLFVLGLFGWAEYVFVLYVSIPIWEPRPLICSIFLLGWHVALCLTLAPYFRCMFTDPGGLPINMRNIQKSDCNDSKWCKKCDLIKPDRSHHCSVCQTCVLKMDHHCPWVNNCVGFRNYKFFILFLMYVPVLCLVFIACAIPRIIASHFRITTPGELQVVVVFLVCLTFGLGLTCFAVAHIGYVLKNVTTLESFGNTSNPYDLGLRANWHQVFGPSPWFWFLPTRNSIGDGLTFPRNDERVVKVIEHVGEEEKNQEEERGVLLEE